MLKLLLVAGCESLSSAFTVGVSGSACCGCPVHPDTWTSAGSIPPGNEVRCQESPLWPEHLVHVRCLIQIIFDSLLSSKNGGFIVFSAVFVPLVTSVG